MGVTLSLEDVLKGPRAILLAKRPVLMKGNEYEEAVMRGLGRHPRTRANLARIFHRAGPKPDREAREYWFCGTWPIDAEPQFLPLPEDPAGDLLLADRGYF